VATGVAIIWQWSTSVAGELGGDRITALVMAAVATARFAVRVARVYWRHGHLHTEFPPDR